MSLMLDVDGLGTCMAHPRRETPTCERVRRASSFFRDSGCPTPSTEKPNGVLSPRLLAAPDQHRPPASGPPRYRSVRPVKRVVNEQT